MNKIKIKRYLAKIGIGDPLNRLFVRFNGKKQNMDKSIADWKEKLRKLQLHVQEAEKLRKDGIWVLQIEEHILIDFIQQELDNVADETIDVMLVLMGSGEIQELAREEIKKRALNSLNSK